MKETAKDILLGLEDYEEPQGGGGIYPGKPKEAPKNLDFEAGTYTVGRVSKQMDHSFKHGKARGETTHISQIDPHFTWKRGDLTAMTGFPQNGKTELTLFMMLVKSYFDKWRWIVYSPENFPADELFDTLIHALMQQTVDPLYKKFQMSQKAYDMGKEFVEEHFIYIYPNEPHTPEVIREYVKYHLSKGKFDGTLKDPWNQMVHSYSGREDLYLGQELPQEKKQARENNLCSIITVHPNGTALFSKNGDYKAPNQFNISGGQMWNNMCDNILVTHRPDYMADPKSTTAEFHSKKIKKQKLVGFPGIVDCNFNRATNNYEFNGASPLIKPGVQRLYTQPEIDLPTHPTRMPANTQPGRDFIEPKHPF